jgi:hypothetical protein
VHTGCPFTCILGFPYAHALTASKTSVQAVLNKTTGELAWPGSGSQNTVEPRYNNEHRAFNSYSYNEVIAISNQGLSDHVPHHL